jgi:hypothetical protein
MIVLTADRASFAANRRKTQEDAIRLMELTVRLALDRFDVDSDWYTPILGDAHDLFDKIVRADGGDPDRAQSAWRRLSNDLRTSLTRTTSVKNYSTTLIATYVTGAVINTAAVEAAHQGEEPFALEWISMHDDRVRATHAEADGQTVRLGQMFRVGRANLRWPGDTRAPIGEWINCRCTLAPVAVPQTAASSVDTDLGSGGETMTKMATEQTETEAPPIMPIPWHGVLAPEGVWSGDKRMFKSGSLSHRNLPLPLTYQKTSDDGHKGSVTVASIEYVYKDDAGLLHAGGTFMQTDEADEAIGLIAHFGRYGVSVDADDAEFDFDEENEGLAFSKARVAGASLVGIPAFQEAYVMLGEDPDYTPMSDDGEDLAAALDQIDLSVLGNLSISTTTDGVVLYNSTSANSATFTLPTIFVSEKSWDGSASRFTPEQWKASCILHVCDGMEKSCHKLPIKEPGGELSRAGVHAAASRISQVDAPSSAISAAKTRLRSAYRSLGEDPPESLALTGEDFGRGPGWITNPADTKRIHDYWTRPGEEGYIKIGWGTPGDFNRCRTLVGEKIAENSPDKIRFLNQTCAQWHKDATGFWPGHAPAERAASLESPEGEAAPAISLVASVGVALPGAAFADPGFASATPITVTDDGWISGHLATWGTCHTGFDKVCVQPPPSANDYAYFLTGEVLTTDGPIPVGNIVMGGGHAPHEMGVRRAVSFYDSTSTVVADVACGEDDHGIWVAGMLRDNLSDDQIREFRASSLSGDWRKVRLASGASMELIAALCVNSPGFPVARVGTWQGQQTSLVASAYAAEEPTTEHDLDDFAERVAAALEERAARRVGIEKMAAELDCGCEEDH